MGQNKFWAKVNNYLLHSNLHGIIDAIFTCN